LKIYEVVESRRIEKKITFNSSNTEFTTQEKINKTQVGKIKKRVRTQNLLLGEAENPAIPERFWVCA